MKSTTWTPDSNHLIAVGTTENNLYFHQEVDISDLTVQRASIANLTEFTTEKIKRSCILGDLLLVSPSNAHAKVFDISEGKMRLVKELKNSIDAVCGDSGFYSLEKGGKIVTKYDRDFNKKKEKKYTEEFFNLEAKGDMGTVLSSRNKIYFLDEDMDLIEEL